MLCFLFLATIATPVLAVKDDQVHHQKYNRQHGYCYYQNEDEHGRIIREYRNNKKGQSREYTCSVLTELGMGEGFIDKLSDEKIDMYANAESITSITTYTRTDTSGNVEIVSEDVALEGAASTWVLDPPAVEDFEGDFSYPDPTYTGSLNNTYIKITFVVTYKGDALYHFSVDAEWLTPPEDGKRFCEAIGICASYITILPETCIGWYSYLRDHPLMYEDNEDKYFNYVITLGGDNNGDGQPDDIRTLVNGNWNGSAAIFSFPNDDCAIGFSDTRVKNYTDFKAHYEFEGVISQPEQTTNFSAIAAYDHCTQKVTVAPTLEFSDSFSGALAFTTEVQHTTYVVQLPSKITYTP